MSKIIASVRIENLSDKKARIHCNATVDTGVSYMVLPKAWRNRLGRLEKIATVQLETPTVGIVEGEMRGPVKIRIEGFRPIYNEVLFVEMEPGDGEYEPLIGYVILQQARIAVDASRGRLMPADRMNWK